MGKNPTDIFYNEVVFGSSDKQLSYPIQKAVKNNTLRKISGKIYTTNINGELAEIVNRWEIISHLYPDAVISHRSALEFEPTQTKQFFITYTYARKMELPGMVLQIQQGQGPMEGDNLFYQENQGGGKLYAASEQRALLKNMEIRKAIVCHAQVADNKSISLLQFSMCYSSIESKEVILHLFQSQNLVCSTYQAFLTRSYRHATDNQ